MRKLRSGGGELGREAHRPQHAQRVVGIGGVGVERSPYYSVGEIPDAPERVDQLAEAVGLEGEGHRVDREVPALLVVLERAVLDYGLAGFAAVGFAARADELNLVGTVAEHRSAEILEIGHVAAGLRAKFEREVDSAALHHHVDVVALAAEETVAHVAAYDEGAHPLGCGDFRNYPEYGFVEEL